jgi:cyclin A
MLIASKYEEIYAPQVDEFCYITDNTYAREDILSMERTVLDALDFELTQPTIKTFLRRCLRAADSDAKAGAYTRSLFSST